MRSRHSRAELTTPGGAVEIVAPPAVVADLAGLFHQLRLGGVATGDPIASLRVAADPDGLTLSLDGRPRAVAVSWRRLRVAFVHELEALVLRRRRDRLALHAGAVALGGEAWLIAGRSGAGKTSTAFHLLEMGAALVTEEVALVDPGGTVARFPRALELDRGLADAWRSRGPLAGGELSESDHGGPPRYRAHRVARHDPPVRGWLVPRYAPSTRGALDELDPGTAVTDLMGHFFEPPEASEAFYDAAIALLESVRIVALTYPDGAAARRLLGRLTGMAG